MRLYRKFRKIIGYQAEKQRSVVMQLRQNVNVAHVILSLSVLMNKFNIWRANAVHMYARQIQTIRGLTTTTLKSHHNQLFFQHDCIS